MAREARQKAKITLNTSSRNSNRYVSCPWAAIIAISFSVHLKKPKVGNIFYYWQLSSHTSALIICFPPRTNCLVNEQYWVYQHIPLCELTSKQWYQKTLMFLPSLSEFQTLFQYAQCGSLKGIHEHTLSFWVRLCMPVRLWTLLPRRKALWMKVPALLPMSIMDFRDIFEFLSIK